jgi:ribosome-binding factor A
MTYRKEQSESTLRRALGEVIEAGLADPRIQGLISVTSVRLSPDQRTAFVHVSVVPDEQAELTLYGLRHAAGHIQSLVAKKVRARQVPRLDFRLDESLKKQAEVLDAIRQAIEEDAENRDPRAEAADATEGPDSPPPVSEDDPS